MRDAIESIYRQVAERTLSRAEALALLKAVQNREVGARRSANTTLHALLHTNASASNDVCFRSHFSGEEFFLRDHVVQGRRVLPGVAYLEMARCAVAAAFTSSTRDRMVRLRNVVWTRPIIIEHGPISVDIGIVNSEDGRISWEIRTASKDSDDSPLIHCRGLAELTTIASVPALDLSELRVSIGEAVIDGEQCYSSFQSSGLDYGPGHRAIAQLYYGSDRVLVKLSLPPSVSRTLDEYVLHPSLMDAAFQSTIGLALGDAALAKPLLPFALESLEVMSPCQGSMWACVRRSAGTRPGDRVQKLDIDLCDDSGRVCVRMKGLSSRPPEGFETEAGIIGTLIASPAWIEKPIPPDAPPQSLAQQIVLCCGIDVKCGGAACIRLDSKASEPDRCFDEAAIETLKLVREQIGKKPAGTTLFQVLVPSRGEGQLFNGLSGLLQTAHLENSNIVGQIIEIDPDESGADLTTRIRENGRCPQDARVRYRGVVREVASWEELSPDISSHPIAWKERGVYLLTGGAGGLGLIFAKEIARCAKGATVVLTGRSPITEGLQLELDNIANSGAHIEYRQSHVADEDAVQDLISSLLSEHAAIDGILHIAGVIRDSYIQNKASDELRQVLAPKVSGALYLDRATRDVNLDFFILFAAGAGVLGNPGQADYATANAWLDAFAHYRNGLVNSGERRGRTLAIDWPLWKDGGMQISQEAIERMDRIHGMIPLDAENGIEALARGLASDHAQVLVMRGRLQSIRRVLFKQTDRQVVAKPQSAVSEFESGDLKEKIQSILVRFVSGLLKVKLNDIDVGTEFNDYGFDSVTLTEFANQLNQKYQLALAPTLFFEHPTVESLAQYLSQEFPHAFASKSRTGSRDLRSPASDPLHKPEPPPPTLSEPAGQAAPRATRSTRVAVIGMSGRFPMAENLDAFWENLLAGRDCIGEIPADRWDWRAIYGDPHLEKNKTNIKWGGFIEGVGGFDPLFFGISPREAATMDPQQRLLMEYVWRAIEDAGYSAESLAGSNTGIFVGTANTGYESLVARSQSAIEGHSSTGLVPSVGPNRMSYFMDWHGPSEPVETACSSSLVAIHRAMLAMESGGCDMAVVGGVNTIVSPDAYISFNKAGMLSEDGRCKTFSRNANGYVRGEGVGMIVLKNLAAAEAAGDRIYAVLCSSAENHGGRANSLTAPNPKAQAALLCKAYEKAGFDPGTVTYIETHGTGTELGDPVEINGLKMAFAALLDAPASSQSSVAQCGLGSVKSNIGHLELAAGIAGVIKVLLQLRHKTLVKSLHAEEINPYIRLEGSPFYIVQENRPWAALKDAQGRDVPRRAGVSSFGFGGANAHVVIEEYPAKADSRPSGSSGDLTIVVLSARNEERLKDMAGNLHGYLRSRPNPVLSDIAWTLQVGREPMEERLGLLVSSTEDLLEKLGAYLDGNDGIEDLYRGRIKDAGDSFVALGADEDMAKTVDAWIGKGKFSKLLHYWVRGLSIDWTKLYGPSRPRRISLPAYPFARTRHWIEPAKDNAAEHSLKDTNLRRLHPLLHENISDLHTQRFRSAFTGEEFFLADHRVHDERVLPGVAYLEMARAAAKLASASSSEEHSSFHLRSVVWARPIVVRGSEQEIQINLFEVDERQIEWEIETLPDLSGADPILHGRGVACVVNAEAPPPLNLKALQSEIREKRLGPAECYRAFDGMGLQYGSAYRCIEELRVGRDQVLAKLALPASLRESRAGFVLHPCLMDAALQASMGLLFAENNLNGKAQGAFLPFALDTLEIHAPDSDSMWAENWAWIRRAEGAAPGDAVPRLDIDLCDATGAISVRFRGLSSRIRRHEFGIVHPLLHIDQSSVDEARFLTRFHGGEFFLKDHSQFLPGVVSLEMARAAATHALRQQISGLVNVVWPKPIRVSEKEALLTTSVVKDGDSLRFEIGSDAGVHAKGALIAGPAPQNGTPLDIGSIRSRCAGAMSADECNAFVSQSLHGPSMVAIENLVYNHGEVLAALKLPECVQEGAKSFALHPGMLHGAVLAAIVLARVQEPGLGNILPYSLEEFRIMGEIPGQAYAHVKPSAEGGTRYDIDLAGRQGTIVAAFRGFTLRTIPTESVGEMLFASLHWQLEPLSKDESYPPATDPLFFLAGGEPELTAALLRQWPAARVYSLSETGTDIAQGVLNNFTRVFDQLRDSMKDSSRPSLPVYILVPNQREDYLDSALSGLLATARLEDSRVSGKIVRYSQPIEDLIRFLQDEVRHPGGPVEVRYQPSGVREVKRLREIELSGDLERPILRPHDVVLITGGMGALGRLLARELSAAGETTIVLCGRSPLDDSGRRFLASLQQRGSKVVYSQCEISRQAEVDRLVADVLEKFGKLNGIIHAAGVIHDAYLLKKTAAEIERVFEPKVAGLLALDHAVRNLPLDFLILFSSISVFGNPGQADYAGANAFMDAFACFRNRRVRQGECHGKTLALNWPLWREGGMTLNSRSERLMRDNTGMAPLDTLPGLKALKRALHSEQEQIFVAQGIPASIRAALWPSISTLPGTKQDPAAAHGTEPQLLRELIRAVAELQKIDLETIDPETELTKYGFDSIGFMELADRLNKELGLKLMPTLFFEYPTLSSLTKQLLKAFPDVIREKFRQAQTSIETPKPAETIASSRLPQHKRVVRQSGQASHTERTGIGPIAVIGISGRFPGSANVDEFWRNLAANRDLITEVPPDRWDWRAHYGDPAKEPGKTKVKSAGFMADVDRFDPLFFGISPLEAESMDPQLRLFLETVWAAVEDAGYPASALSGSRTGVFVGVTTSDYKEVLERDGDPGIRGSATMFHFEIPNRISWLLNLRGPSEPIDTACSSSLIAVHRAIESIRQGSCEMALAGGVNVIVSVSVTAGASQAGMLSEDGRCRTFDKSASGYGRGEGIGAVFLKPLERALRDGDQIYGVIRGSSENHGGRAASPTSPNPQAQKELIVEAYTRADIDPATIGYIEAHGTGTELGDPIEFDGLRGAFERLNEQRGRSAIATSAHCAVGSVKANIGHLEAAAGISALIKVLLMLKHREIPGNVHLKDQNPFLRLDGTPFYLPRETKRWEALLDSQQRPIPRRAGVSSFGIGGSNAHVIVEEFLPVDSPGQLDDIDAPGIVLLSAKDESRVYQAAKNLAAFCRAHPSVRLSDLAYTLQVGREAMSERMGLVVGSVSELERELQRFAGGEHTGARIHRGTVKRRGATTAPVTPDEQAIGKLIELRNFDELVQRWVHGQTLDWNLLYRTGKPRRISLPSYPFARERHWVSGKNLSYVGALQGKVLINDAEVGRLKSVVASALPDVERRVLALLWAGLQSLGLFNGARSRITGFYDRWFDETAGILERAGYLQGGDNGVWKVIGPKLDLEEEWNRWHKARNSWAQDNHQTAQFNLIESCLRGLPDILQGVRPATAVLFPRSSVELVEKAFKGTPTADLFNGVLGDALIAYIQERLRRNPGEKIRILEIGAGTGGTTAGLLRRLQPLRDRIEEYCYTDLSRAFLMHAEKNYAPEAPFLTTRIFNVSKPLEGQDVTPSYFDVAIAANVLHATTDIRQTVRNAKACLKSRGALFLNEVSRNSLIAHVTFGLVEGWWLYEDAELRIPGCPALTPESWKAVLDGEGFREVLFPAQSAHELGQQIIVAESDGLTPRAARKNEPKPERASRQTSPIGDMDGNSESIEQLVRKTIVEQLSAALKLPANRIATDESFSDYGVDSITGIKLVELINETLGIELETTSLFDYSSVGELTRFVVSAFGDAVASKLRTRKNEPDPVQAAAQVNQTTKPTATPGAREPIAVIGMSGRFAQSETVHKFWENLAQGKNLVEKVTRWDLSLHEDKENPNCNYGSFLEDIDKFDPFFFNISGLEATCMDPQQRLFLEESWNALEDAGYAGDAIEGKPCGVYVGCSKGDYMELFQTVPPAQAFWGNTAALVPARISYYLNLKGPAVAIDTACSSSLVAIHTACAALRSGEVDMALAGGVLVQSSPGYFLMANKAGMLSPTGKCHTFDKDADGFVPGECVGAILLKRLGEAVQDGDHIYAVIEGSAINQDGRSNGITAPSAQSQERLEQQVYDQFGIDPGQIQMIEAHGTGTALGDPIECNALIRAFRHYTDKREYCALGSVKTNIGHAATGAGIAGFIKILLSLKHRRIPPSLHFQAVNPKIALAGSPFYVNTSLSDWKVGKNESRRAAVSSFGFSGTNAHVVIGEAPELNRVHPDAPAYLVLLSAQSQKQLRLQVERLDAFLPQNEAVDLGNLSFTLAVGRKHWNYRFALIARNMDELKQGLKKWLDQGQFPGVYTGEINEAERPLQPALKKLGNDCVQACRLFDSTGKYLDNLSTIADLFVQGYRLELAGLFETGYTRIPLPTYPFARNRYWVPEPAEKPASQKKETEPVEPLTVMRPVWNRIPSFAPDPAPGPDDSLVVVGGTDEQRRRIRAFWRNSRILDAERLGGSGPVGHIIWLAPVSRPGSVTSEDIVRDQGSGALALFRLVKTLLSLDYGLRDLSLTLITTNARTFGDNQPANPAHASVHGMAGSLAKEYPHWHIRMVDLAPDEEFAIREVFALPANRPGNVSFRRGKEWFEQSLVPVEDIPAGDNPTTGNPANTALYRPGGVYVVIGGAGGVGVAWSRWMIQHYQAQIVWIGRRNKDAAIQTNLHELSRLGPPPVYVQADATNRLSLENALAEIRQTHPGIHGVVHSAVVMVDQSFSRMSEEDFRAVLASKVDVSVRLAQVFSREELDFVLFFSSVQSFYCAPGQANYAAGCVFEDAFARQLRREWSCAVKVVNWGYWGDFGSVASPFYREKMAGFGMGTIPVESGMKVLEQLMSGPMDQLAAIKMLAPAALPRPASPAKLRAPEPAPPVKHIRSTLEQVVRKLLIIPKEKSLDDSTTFIDLGLDSVVIVRFIKELSDQFQLSLRETLVYDYPTIGGLTQFIADMQVQQAPPAPQLEAQESAAVAPAADKIPFIEQLGRLAGHYRELVPLQVEGDGPLLFCFHPMSGDVGIYNKLADGSAKRFRVIGVQSRGFLTSAEPLTTIESMGRYYAGIVTAVDASGPYHLFGASMGGTLAYECARQLRLQGRSVRTLVMAEAPVVTNEADAPLWDSGERENWIMNANFLMITLLHLDSDFRRRKAEGHVDWTSLQISGQEIVGVPDEEIPRRLAAAIQRRGVNRDTPALIERLDSMARIHLANLRSINQYRPEPFPDEDGFVSAQLRTESGAATSDLVYNPDYLINVQKKKGSILPFLEPWEALLPRLETHLIDGQSHFDILNSETSVHQVAGILVRLMSPVASSAVASRTSRPPSTTRIAVIGMSGRFPGANTLDDFWQLLKDGRSAIGEPPADRDWDSASLPFGGFLDDVSCFEPLFFQIPPKEAEFMDPSERLFLEESWKAIEDAGVNPRGLSKKRWSVFCGGSGDYTLRLKEILGTSPHLTASTIPGRVSYCFDLVGPSVMVDAGCASSLVAVTQACDSLVLGRSDVAIAGGVWVSSTPNLLRVSSDLQMLSGEDLGRAFDSDAKGMIPGEAVAALVLKPFDRAVEDGDRIHAVIEAWGTSNSGRTNGISAPSVAAEMELFSGVYNTFGINPASIGFVEGNGTGTPLGDRMEVEALTGAFRKHTPKNQFCALGSVENNIGHAWHCSGMSHIIKTILALKHREIPATINATSAASAFRLERTPFYLNSEHLPWSADAGMLRRAAVSSFGAIGTNGHIVLSEPPPQAASGSRCEPSAEPQLVVLSANTEASLNRRARDLKGFLAASDRSPSLSLARLAANLFLRRSHHSKRLALVVSSLDGLLDRLSEFIGGEEPGDGVSGAVRGRVRDSQGALAGLTVKSLIGGQLARRDALLALAELYVQGAGFDLSECFRDADKIPLSLPGYPFERNRYWAAGRASPEAPLEASPSVANRPLSENSEASFGAAIQETITNITGYAAGDLDPDASLSLYGVDSLLSTRLVAELNERYSLDIQLADFAENNSISRLAALLVKECGESLPPPSNSGKSQAALRAEDFSPEARWFVKRLTPWPDSLQLATLDCEPRGSKTGSLESCMESLDVFLQAGVALFRDTARCYLLAHRDVDVRAILNSLTPAMRAELLESLPDAAVVAPVSQEQERNLYHSEVMRQSALNVQHVYEITGDSLDLKLFNKALFEIQSHQDTLRTCYIALNRKKWAQVILPDATLEAGFLEFSDLSGFQSFIAVERARLFETSQAPLWKIWVSRIANCWYAGFVAHHSLADAFTTTMLFTAVMSCYRQLSEQEPLQMQTVEEQYWQYSLRQFASDKTGNHEYWAARLKDQPVSMRLPYTKAPVAGPDGLPQEMGAHIFSLPVELGEAVARFHGEHDITHTQLITAAISLLLVPVLGNEKAAFQFNHNRRERASLMNTLGEFTNILYMLVSVDRPANVLDYLRQVKKDLLDQLRHKNVSFRSLLQLTGLNDYDSFYRQSGDVLIDSADIDTGTVNTSRQYGRSLFAGTLVAAEQPADRHAPCALSFLILKADERLHFITAYRKRLFDFSTIEEISALVVRIVEEMVRRPHQATGRLLEGLSDRIERLRKTTEPPSSGAISPSGAEKRRQAIECQRLNPVREGRPVFWVHGGFGDASVYIPLAGSMQRPFYGIQARGLFDEKPPLAGVENIAAFYTELIQSVQPDGPLDLGGYSVGGILAFETARQLQRAGRRVRSLTLVDSLAPAAQRRFDTADPGDEIFSIAATLIALTRREHPESIPDLIGGLEKTKAAQINEDALVNAYAQYCLKAGVGKPLTWIRAYIGKMAAIRRGYRAGDYRGGPLESGIAIVRYFRNKKGLFYGEQAKFFNPRSIDPLDGVDYWSDWKGMLPNVEFHDLDVDSHLTLFEDPCALRDIQDFCCGIYHPVDGKPDTDVLGTLRRFIGDLVDLPAAQIAPDGHPRDYGIDSLSGMRLLNRINQSFEINSDASLIMKTTIRDVAGAICGEIQAKDGAAGHKAARSDFRSSLQSEGWTRPPFIECLSVPLASAVTACSSDELTQAHNALHRLIENGIGLWTKGGKLHFEFLRGRHDMRSLRDLGGAFDLLPCILKKGEKYFPASFAQEIMLQGTEVDRSPATNIFQGFWIEMPVDLALLNKAFNQTVQHHSIFRTGARLAGNRWMQVIHDELRVECRELNWNHLRSRSDFLDALAELQRKRSTSLLDIGRTPLMEVFFAHNNRDLGAVFVHTHHFHADGFTLFLFQQELYRRYKALLDGAGFVPSRISAEYGHFALSQFGEEYGSHTDYWIGKLNRQCPEFSIPDKTCQSAPGLRTAGVVELEISDHMLEKLQCYNRQSKTTLTQLICCALGILLYRLAGCPVSIHMACNLRDRSEFESVMGDFSSLLPVILDIQPESTIREVLSSYDNASLEIQRHKRCTPRGMGFFGNIILDSNDRDTLVEVTDFAEKLVQLNPVGHPPIGHLLVLMMKTNRKLSLLFMFDRNRFSEKTIQLIAQNLRITLDQIVEDSEKEIAEVDLTPELRDRLDLADVRIV